MSYNRRRMLAIWIGVGAIYALWIVGSVASAIVRAPAGDRVFYALPLLIPILLVLAMVMRILSDRRANSLLTGPDTVSFSTQNVPGNMDHVESFVVPGTRLAGGRTFVLVANEPGISYFTPGRNPVDFVRIPWAEIASVEEFGGELCITLTDGSLLLHVPGGMLPVGVKRVRELARQIAALQPARRL